MSLAQAASGAQRCPHWVKWVLGLLPVVSTRNETAMSSREAVITQAGPYKAVHFAESNGLLVSYINLETWYLFLKSEYSRVWGQIPSSLVCVCWANLFIFNEKELWKGPNCLGQHMVFCRKMCQVTGWDGCWKVDPRLGGMLRLGKCPCPWHLSLAAAPAIGQSAHFP